MSDRLTKTQAEAAFAAVHKYAQQWTSHKTFCKRLRAEVLGEKELPAYTCGYFAAVERVENELAHIRGKTKPKTAKAKR